MKLSEWHALKVGQHFKEHEVKVRQFSLTPVLREAEQLTSFTDIIESMQQLGVWALQHSTPILQAIHDDREFCVLVGFRPSRFHLGHITLIQELLWYMDHGAKPIFIVSGHEANTSLSADQARKKVLEFWQILLAESGQKIPEPDHIYSDKECLDLRLLEDRVEECVPAQKIFQLYGWKSEISVAVLRVATKTAAAFLFPRVLFPKLPVVVLSDINQVTHSEVAKIVSRKMGITVPAFSYRVLLPSLLGPQKRMSIRNERSAIFLNEDVGQASKKLRRCFSGGRRTVSEQREQGGNPFVCSFFSVCRLLLSGGEVEELLGKCVSGQASCGDCKSLYVQPALKRLEQLASSQEAR